MEGKTKSRRFNISIKVKAFLCSEKPLSYLPELVKGADLRSAGCDCPRGFESHSSYIFNLGFGGGDRPTGIGRSEAGIVC